MQAFLIALASLAALVLAPPVPIASAQADPEAIARQYIEAHNRGDVEAVLALLTDDAVVVNAAGGLCEPTPCVGKAAIRRELERRVAIGAQFTLIGVQVSGTTVVDRHELRHERVRAAGAERALISHTYEVRDGKIASIRGTLDGMDPQTAAYIAQERGRGPAPAGPAPAQIPRSG
jgi:hypothetical protein